MKQRAKQASTRITGFSTPLFGASWTAPPSERQLVEELFDQLEDRRVLFNAYEAEVPRGCIESIRQIRSIITSTQVKSQGQASLRDHLRAMSAACRSFLDAVEPTPQNNHRDWGHGMGDTMEFNSALGGLRALIGVQLALLSTIYEVEIPPTLVTILPPEVSRKDG